VIVSGRPSGRRFRRLATPFVTIVIAASSGCASRSGPAAARTSSPIASLQAAVNAVLTASSFTLVTTELGLSFSPGGDGRTVTRALVEKPDRIALSGGPNVVIAIGSTGYFPAQRGKWTVHHHAGESANFMNSTLVFLHVLDRTTSVSRQGDTYVVPPTEVVTLLNSTLLPEWHDATGVSWSATVRGGSLRSMTLHFTQGPQPIGGTCGTTSCTLSASPVTVTITVSRVGSSPAVNAPAPAAIVS
jgi:hypothetical protein